MTTATDVRAARAAAEQIKAIDNGEFTPAHAAHLCAVLSAKISACPWGHWTCAVNAIQELDDCVDLMQECPE